jgi:predicted DsbA family dithiol-disulfide isomerase
MKFRIEVFSDVICPWCYVGQRRLEKALNALGEEHQVEVRWRPFELNPQMPRDGMERRAYRAARFGNWEQARARDAQLAQIGAQEGIAFAFEQIARTPNTFTAHRLVWLAQREGVEEEVVRALFRAYFTEGRDVGDPETLVRVGAEAGLDADRVRQFLAGSEGAAEVRRSEERAHALGISGVPAFVIEGRYVIEGAQRPELITASLQQIAAESAASGAPAPVP